MAKSQELCDFDKRETAMLGLLDEADAPQRIAIVEPITGVALTGRREQAFPLVITQRIGADIRQRGELANRQHANGLPLKGVFPDRPHAKPAR